MKSIFAAMAMVVLLLLVQTSLLAPHITPAFRPDLLLIAVVYLALYTPAKKGVVIAYLLGLLKDVVAGLFLGLHAFSFLVIFLAIRSMAHRLYTESPLLHLLVVSAACCVSVLLNFLLLLIFSESRGIFISMTSDLVPHLLSTAFCTSLVSLIPLRRLPVLS